MEDSNVQPDPKKLSGALINTESGWRPLLTTLPVSNCSWDAIMEQYAIGVWFPLMREARAKRQEFAEIELGDPSTESGREYFAASVRRAEAQNLQFETAAVPDADSTRFVLRLFV